MRQRVLGEGLTVSELGLGCMGMSQSYGPADDGESVATIHRALDEGVTLLDTADAYGPFTNEQLVGSAVKGRRDEVVLATKFGNVCPPGGPASVNGRPEYVRKACDASLARLGTGHIDLYYQHRVDPDVPVEETWGAMSELVSAGKVRYLGLCEAAPETVRRAHAVHPVAVGQYEYSLVSQDPDGELLPVLRELGIGMVCSSPLGRGLLTGAVPPDGTFGDNDFRGRHPSFQGENLGRNLRLAAGIAELAALKGVTCAQLALAWVLARGTDLAAIPGAKRRSHLELNVAAAGVVLTPDELAELGRLAPPGAGGRCPPGHLARAAL